DHELVTAQGRRQGFHHRVDGRLAAVHDRAAADLDDVAVWQHAHHRRFGGGHDLLVEQAFAHQERAHVMAAVLAGGGGGGGGVGVEGGGRASLSSRDDGADGFAVEGAGQVARHQAVDDLDGAAVLGVLHQLQHAVLDDDVVQVQGLQLPDGNARDELGGLILLRVGRVQAVLVLDVDHRPRPEDL